MAKLAAAAAVLLLYLSGCASPPAASVTAGRAPVKDWFQRANELAERSELQAAVHAYQRALALEPNTKTKALHNLGLVQLRLGLQNLREALAKLPPEHPAQRQTRDFVRLLLSAEL